MVMGSLDSGSLDQARVDTTEISAPTSIPNSVLDGGSVNFGKYANPVIPVSALSAGEDGVIMNQIIEDPARSRLLGLTHIRQTGGINRQLFLWSAPWGHPEGPWTRLNPAAAPLVALGVASFDSTNVFDGCGFVAGRNLYLAYAGTSGASTESTGKVGLAQADLTQAAPVATKLGQLQIGNSPYYGYPAGVQNINGGIVLWIAQAAASGDWMNPSVPRPFYSTVFGAAAANWTADHKFFVDGSTDVGAGKHPCLWQQVYLGEDRWARVIPDGTYANNLSLYLTEMRGEDRLNYCYLANVAQNTPPDANHAFDSARMFYHQRKWYFTAGSFAVSGPGVYEVCLGIYDTTTPLPLANQAQTRSEYPYSWHGAVASQPTVGYRQMAAGGTILDFSVAGQITVTGTAAGQNILSVPGMPAFKAIDTFLLETTTGGGYLRTPVTWRSNPSIPASQVWLKIYMPETGGTAGPGAEIAEAAAWTFGPMRIGGKTC